MLVVAFIDRSNIGLLISAFSIPMFISFLVQNWVFVTVARFHARQEKEQKHKTEDALTTETSSDDRSQIQPNPQHTGS